MSKENSQVGSKRRQSSEDLDTRGSYKRQKDQIEIPGQCGQDPTESLGIQEQKNVSGTKLKIAVTMKPQTGTPAE
jgi:hypothetical protein